MKLVDLMSCVNAKVDEVRLVEVGRFDEVGLCSILLAAGNGWRSRALPH